jgi:hypothetical protein
MSEVVIEILFEYSLHCVICGCAIQWFGVIEARDIVKYRQYNLLETLWNPLPEKVISVSLS